MTHELLAGPLAIEPGYLQSILPALQQHSTLLAAPTAERTATFATMASVPAPKQAYGDGASSSPGKVAIIPMEGLLTKRMSYYGYGYRMLNSWLEQAFADPEVVGIVLKSDSPGGTVDGNEETTQLVANAPKPIVTWVDGMCCSAAYRIASQSSAIVVGSATAAIVGSIGTYQEHRDVSKALEMMGEKITFITADGNDFKVLGNGTEVLSEEAIAYFKERLNPMNEAFKADVQAGRGKKVGKDSDVFQSKVYNGQDAVKQGLADSIGTLTEAVRQVSALAAKKATSTSSNQSIMLKTPRLGAALAALGFIQSADAALEANSETLAKAEEVLAASEAKATDLSQQLSTATASVQTLTTELGQLKATNQTLTTDGDKMKEQLQTLEAWKKEQQQLGGHQGDARDEGTKAPRASYNKAADEHRARMAGTPAK